jgi:hypothetical protein
MKTLTCIGAFKIQLGDMKFPQLERFFLTFKFFMKYFQMNIMNNHVSTT